MPKRRDMKKFMIIGSGRIIIGQAAEFRSLGFSSESFLREEGYTTIVVNSNPATIQTDSQIADIVYIEPLNVETLVKIIEIERPGRIVPRVRRSDSAQPLFRLAQEGILDRYGVELLGSNRETIGAAQNRNSFRSSHGAARRTDS